MWHEPSERRSQAKQCGHDRRGAMLVNGCVMSVETIRDLQPGFACDMDVGMGSCACLHVSRSIWYSTSYLTQWMDSFECYKGLV